MSARLVGAAGAGATDAAVSAAADVDWKNLRRFMILPDSIPEFLPVKAARINEPQQPNSVAAKQVAAAFHHFNFVARNCRAWP
jgi:hypothetical protein